MSKNEIKRLEAEMQALRQRIDKLESLLASATKGASEPKENTALPSPPQPESATDLVLVISAAVAAFLGKRASIRQIRLTGETPWAMQGRATVQASHGIEFIRGLR
jgi:methylmalonyl-CoA carboxyltransferase large subunit